MSRRVDSDSMKLLCRAIFLESYVADRVGLLNDESWLLHSSEAKVDVNGSFLD